MTPDELDRPLTAADLLFGSAVDTPKALTSHIMSAGATKSLGGALAHLPRVTREAAVREAADAAAGLLRIDLMEMLVTGWREHREIIGAARRTLATPASKELVGLGAHRITTIQQPAVGILLDGRRVHTLQLGVSIIFDVTALVAGVSVGRLAGVHSGRCDVGVALTVHEVEVLTKRAHLELPGVKALSSGIRLLSPASTPPTITPAAGTPRACTRTADTRLASTRRASSRSSNSPRRCTPEQGIRAAGTPVASTPRGVTVASI
ncbi:MAG: hypothetical protein M3Z75_02475 [Actinomycetota bacterium]|nr:hypothetical protein [Actinomycetota bacterium]